jgi:poly(A) polymerase
MLLDRTPKDYDVATDAKPARVQELFPRARLVGAKFGVVLVRKSGFDTEVATFRSDGPYSDGRHPDAVTFGTEIEDARRRDFTINGLFFDPLDDRVIDYVGGRDDLAAAVIRTIGDPDHRFSEDHLRMLRAVRLAARLGFTIEPQTANAIERLAPNLKVISAERIWRELEEILTAPTRAAGWSLLVQLGLCDHLATGLLVRESLLAPTLRPDSAIQRRLTALPASPIDPALALAVLLCDGGVAAAKDVCRALRLSNRLTQAVVWLVGSLPMLRTESDLELADLKILMAEPNWPQLVELLRVDLIATAAYPAPYEYVCRRAEAIDSADVAPPPLLSGDDLAAMGMPPGPRFGEILNTIYRAQLNTKITTRDEANIMAGELMMS